MSAYGFSNVFSHHEGTNATVVTFINSTATPTTGPSQSSSSMDMGGLPGPLTAAVVLGLSFL